MAEARRCDRCNEFYSINDKNEKRGEYPVTRDHKKVVYSMTIYDNNVNRIKHLDLCPKCSRSLIVWLNDWGQYEDLENDIPNSDYKEQLLYSGFGECPHFKSESSGLMCRQSSTCDKPCKSVELYNMCKSERENDVNDKLVETDVAEVEEDEDEEENVKDNTICKTCKFHSLSLNERPCCVCKNYDLYQAHVVIAKAEDVLKNAIISADIANAEARDCKRCKYDNILAECDPCVYCNDYDRFEPKEDEE